MDINIIKYLAFLKTVECGSFTKASEVLQYSQSGISRMIGDLEQEWNLSLLERGRFGVKLTSDGEMLLPHVQSVYSEYKKLQIQVDELHGLQSGIIRIAAFTSVSEHWLPEILRKFHSDYPEIHFELLLGHYHETENWVANGIVDCGFICLPVYSELEIITQYQDPLMIVLPENHPLAGCEKFPIEALCEEPSILLAKKTGADVLNVFEKNHLKPSLKSRIHLNMWDDDTILSMVETGLGICIEPKLSLYRTPYHIVAKELSVPAYRTIGFGVKRKETCSCAVKKFMEYLISPELLP